MPFKNRVTHRIELMASSTEVDVQAAADGKPKTRPTFEIIAYTGGPLKVGYDLPVVIDLKRLRAKRDIPVLYEHDPKKVVGQSRDVRIHENKIELSGLITGDNEYAKEVVSQAANGFKWHASVGVELQKLERVDARADVVVNGNKFKGPLYVARDGRLLEVSFVSLGADEDAQARVVALMVPSFGDCGGEKMSLEEQSDKPKDAPTVFNSALKSKVESKMESNYEPAPGEKDKPTGTPTGNEDPGARLRAAEAAEIERIDAIRAAGRDHGAEGKLIAQAVRENWTSDKAELEFLRASRPRLTGVTHGRNERPEQVIEAALLLSAGMAPKVVGERFDQEVMNRAMAGEYQGFGLHALCHAVIQAGGGHARPGVINGEFIRETFRADAMLRAAGGFSTVSLSGILSNVANKTLLESFSAVEAVAERIASRESVSDFKSHNSYRLTAGGEFEEVGPGGELKHASLEEQEFTNKALTYGQMIVLTRQMIVNDDLGAFTRIARLLGRKAAVKREKVLFELLLSNPSSFFSAGNANYITGVDSALSIDALTAAEQLFMDQTDSAGDPIGVSPAILLVPTALKVTAQRLMTETRVNETTTTNKPKPGDNPHAGKWTPLASPFLNAQGLSGQSSTGWYLLADPNVLAAAEIVYLNGRNTPVIENGEPDFSTLGMAWRGYFDFGAAMQDHRAAVFNTGAA